MPVSVLKSLMCICGSSAGAAEPCPSRPSLWRASPAAASASDTGCDTRRDSSIASASAFLSSGAPDLATSSAHSPAGHQHASHARITAATRAPRHFIQACSNKALTHVGVAAAHAPIKVLHVMHVRCVCQNITAAQQPAHVTGAE